MLYAGGMNLSSRQPGPTNGLRLYLYVDQANYLYTMSSSAGFRVWNYFLPSVALSARTDCCGLLEAKQIFYRSPKHYK